jgi:hypothetical protein
MNAAQVPYQPLRLREAVLSGGVHPHATSDRLAATDRAEWAAALQQLRSLVATAPTVRIDNVLAAFDEPATGEELWAGIPMCVPPVTPLWLEGTGPVPLADGEGGRQVQARTLGALVNARSTGPGATMDIELWIFLAHDRSEAVCQVGLRYQTDAQGGVVGGTTGTYAPLARYYERFLGEQRHGLAVMANRFGLALSFMHCQNVRRTRVEPGRWLQQTARRGRPYVTYDVLEIGPMRQVMETEGGLSHNGLPKALHICRGHFATYTLEKPLFGKLVGRFWVPMHVRGSAERGVAIRDYEIKP